MLDKMDIETLDAIENYEVLKSLLRARYVLGVHHNIAVSVSGGSDSDIVLDLVQKAKENKEVQYIWFDTGIEYDATKRHLVKLENKYSIKIQRIKAQKPIPLCVRDFGLPFVSKYASSMIERLQKHGFKWEDKPIEVLLKDYPRCQQAVKWWCNANESDMFNIGNNRFLKEFLIANPPQFKISARCCDYAKKNVSKHFIKENHIDLMVVGIRRAEGGVRAGAYQSCFTDSNGLTADQYRPIFFYDEADKTYYERMFDIVHSDCYTKYGFKRTGCVGCPFALDLDNELEQTARFEPKLYNLCTRIFGVSYEYTRAYRRFRDNRKEFEQSGGQLNLFDD